MDQGVSRLGKVVLFGGSGQIGQTLARHFHGQGVEVISVSRTPHPAPWTTVAWDGKAVERWTKSLEGADAVINLAGSSINTRFTPEHRSLILDSRLDATRVTAAAIRSRRRPPRVWLNASAVDIYPHALAPTPETTISRYQDTGAMDSTTPESWRFLSEVVWRWEETFRAEQVPGTRKVALRTTLMLSPDQGGVFRLLSTLARFGLGGPQGSGEQFVSWMHHTDYARAVEFLIEREDIAGPVNITSPQPLPNREFMRLLRQAVRMPIGLPAPAFGIQLSSLLLRTEPVLVLKSRCSVPAVLQQHGFKWSFPDWPGAVQDLVKGH